MMFLKKRTEESGTMKKRILLEQKLLFAKELVRRQSTAEDAKAFEDILIINDLYVKKGDSSFNPFREDDRVRREYPIIELLEIWNKNKICSGERREFDFLNRLENDMFGIFVDVLLKHGMIKDYKEMVVA
ncbi:hypothetical protein D7Y06_18255 [Roseburia sp. 1XD42-69]|jgi:hypothetical protein|nr:hypothetical protein D7Y06_18255 [Roseburia sp. 1XD42-69]